MPGTTDPILCDEILLSRYLAGQLVAHEQATLESHLNSCVDCRESMQALAADDDFWSATTQALHSFDATKAYSPREIDLSLSALCARANRNILTDQLDSFTDSLGSQMPDLIQSQSQMLERWLESSTQKGILGSIGKYDVMEIVGQGGMGLVLRALDTELQREVAIKTMAHHFTSRPDARLRFAREARTVAGLSHPHIVPVFGMETWRDVPLIVMPFVAGGTLQQYATAHPLNPEEVLVTAHQIALALSALHAEGIVHRDLKPSNILLKNGLAHVLLSDFGLARSDEDAALTQSNALAGTPHFMSPEQALGRHVDVRSDLFSFGSLIFWLCTGNYPFPGGSSYETLSQIVNLPLQTTELTRRQVPSYVQRLLCGLLEKEPEARWKSADQVAELLLGCLTHLRSPERPLPSELTEPDSKSKVGKIAYRGLWVVATCAAFVISGVAIQRHYHDNHLRLEEPFSAAHTETIQTRKPPERYGPLDALDREAMISDLAASRNLHYWLRRMAYLPVDEIPAESLPAVQTLVQHSDLATRQLAQVILFKNPFQEVNYQSQPAIGLNEPTIENPFQEVFRDETHP